MGSSAIFNKMSSRRHSILYRSKNVHLRHSRARIAFAYTRVSRAYNIEKKKNGDNPTPLVVPIHTVAACVINTCMRRHPKWFLMLNIVSNIRNSAEKNTVACESCYVIFLFCRHVSERKYENFMGKYWEFVTVVEYYVNSRLRFSAQIAFPTNDAILRTWKQKCRPEWKINTNAEREQASALRWVWMNATSAGCWCFVASFLTCSRIITTTLTMADQKNCNERPRTVPHVGNYFWWISHQLWLCAQYF